MRTNIVYFRTSVTEKSSAKKDSVQLVCTIAAVNPWIYQYPCSRLDHAGKPSQEKIMTFGWSHLGFFQCQFDILENSILSISHYSNRFPYTGTDWARIIYCNSRILLLSSRGEHCRVKNKRLGFTNSFSSYMSTRVTTFSVASLTYLLVRREGSPVTFSSGHEYSMEGQLDFKYAMAFKSLFIFQALS